MPRQTPSQTTGPFLRISLLRGPQNRLVSGDTEGERIRIEGRVVDGEGVGMRDAMVEIWQANAHGRYNHPEDTQDKPLDEAFRGFGRSGTDDDGNYWFETVRPGPVPGPGNTLQAPHIGVIVFARGILLHAYTRIYFAGEDANRADPVLGGIEDEARRATLVAEDAGARDGSRVYRFDIVLQGTGETVFFDV